MNSHRLKPADKNEFRLPTPKGLKVLYNHRKCLLKYAKILVILLLSSLCNPLALCLRFACALLALCLRFACALLALCLRFACALLTFSKRLFQCINPLRNMLLFDVKARAEK